MKVIFKYPINNSEGNPTQVSLPEGFKIIHCGRQGYNNVWYIWAEIDPSEVKRVSYEINIFGTGWDIPEGWEHIHTFFNDAIGTYVWHIYMRPVQ